jgi:hypothetical protein
MKSHRSLLTFIIWIFSVAFSGAAPLTVTGRLVDAQGRAVAGARVDLVPTVGAVERWTLTSQGKADADPAASVATDAAGLFVLPAPHEGMWAVVVHAPGFLPMRLSVEPLLAPLDLPPVELASDAGCRVTVLDPAGRPLGGALVEAQTAEESAPAFSLGRRWRPAPRIGITGADGTVMLARSKGEALSVTASAVGFAEGRQHGTARNTVQLRLSPALPRALLALDSQGRPIAGASVTALESGRILGVTGPDGRLRVEAAPGAGLRLAVETRDGRRATVTVPSGEGGDAVPVTLPAQADRRSGRVLDAVTRKPLAGAFVWSPGEPAGFVRTDAAGAYALTGKGTVWLAAAAGYLPGSEPAGLRPGRGPSFILEPAASVGGAIVDAQGRAIAGAEIQATTAGTGVPEILRGRSDSRGRFTLGGLRPRQVYTLHIVRGGFLPATQPVEPPPPPAVRSDLNIVLRPGRPAFGKVVDEAGQPVAGATVALLPAGGMAPDELSLLPGALAETSSDAQGRFSLDALPVGRLDLRVRAPRFAPVSVRGLAVAAGDRALDLGTVTLPPGATLRGRVEDPQRQPLPDAVVRVLRADPMTSRLALAGSRPETEVLTGADGGFEATALSPGETVSLEVELAGYSRRMVPGLRAGAAEPVRIVITQAARISGRLVGEDGDLIPEGQIVLRPAGAPRGPIRVARTNDGGRFTIEDVEPGSLVLDASAPGHLPTTAKPLRVGAGEDVADLEIVLLRGAVVEGRIETPDGTPALGAEVRLADPPAAGAIPLVLPPSARTDEDGRYQLGGLKPGPHTVIALHPSYARAQRQLDLREGTTTLDLRLGEAREVKGRTVDGAGRDLPGVTVVLGSAGEGDRETLSGPRGEFQFGGLGEGRYRVIAEKEGYAPHPAQDVQVAGSSVSDLELRLERGVGVAGRITGLAFADLARVQVAATRLGVPGETSGRVDYEGRYRIDDLAPGDWIVLARLPGGRWTEGRLTIPEGAADAALDLAFEPAPGR